MEISTFELLVKPIAPRNNPLVTALARRVIQGYFLTITNLDAKDLTYRIEFFQSAPNPPDPDRTLLNNAVLVVDTAGNNSIVPLAQSGNRFSGSFRLPAGQTASVELLPKVTPELLADPNPDVEIRGYVRLRVPALRRRSPFPTSFFTEAQSTTPVKVLLNPEIRGTFVPNDFSAASAGDIDQINYPLTLASGKGLNEITPEPGGPILVSPIVSEVVSAVEAIDFEPTFLEADNLEKTQRLVELMAQLDQSPENLQGLSDALSKLNIPVKVSSVS